MSLIHLRGGLVVPVEALLAALAIERAGHRLFLDDDGDLLIEPRGTVDAVALVELRKWKPHVRMLVAYMPSDTHLRAGAPASSPTATEFGRAS